MQLMAGLTQPNTGEIWFDGQNVTGIPVQKRNVSMVYQQFINYPNMSVYENIASPLRLARLSETEIDSRVGKLAELMRLSPMLDRKPSELSGGQQQRTALARALVKDADLILLDEPLANLDFKLREELRDELPNLFAGRDCTVVYATTEPSEALLLGGHTATLHEGRVAEFGPTGELYRKPGGLISAKVFSEPPINTATVVKRGTEMRLGEKLRWEATYGFRDLPDGTYTLGVRAHFIRPQKSVHFNVAVEGRVLITEISGSESVVHFDIGEETWVSLSHGIHSFEIGRRATLYADLDHAMLFDANGRRMAV